MMGAKFMAHRLGIDIEMRVMPMYGVLSAEGPRMAKLLVDGKVVGRAWMKKPSNRVYMEWHDPPFGTTFRGYLASICRMRLMRESPPAEWRKI